MSAVSSAMYVSQLLFPCRQGGVGVELGTTAEQVCSLVEALLTHQASTQPLAQATGSLHSQATPALHVQACPSCIACRSISIVHFLLLSYSYVLATLLIISSTQGKAQSASCLLCAASMLKSGVGTPWAGPGDRHVVEQLASEVVSSALSCLGHSIQPFSHSSVLYT